MEKTLIFITKFLAISVTLIGFTFFFANDFYNSLVVEDGIIENITALTLLAISLLFLYRIVTNKEQKTKAWIIFNIIIILGSFFGFGEEISWGQRIFSIESSEFFSEYNLQNETNLHNLKINNVKINQLIFSYGFVLVFGFYFILSPFIYKKSKWFKRLVDNFGVQIPTIKHTIFMLVLTACIMTIPDLEKWELWESIFVLLMLLVFLEPYNSKEKLLPSKTK
jgi:hypothetical protein